MINVMIADDQQLIRESLKIVLNTEEEINVSGVVGDGDEVLEALKRTSPDVILMDVRMPKMDGVACTKLVKESYPNVRIIILTTFDDDEYVYDAIRFGASGYLLKGISTEELVKAIKVVYQGQAMLNPDIASKVLKFFSSVQHDDTTIAVDEELASELNENEWKIIKEVAKGHSKKEFSEILSFSQGTVRNYLSTILEKLGLRDRTQLAIWALERRSGH